MNNSDIEKPLPWWKFWHVWLVISGPVVVVIAGLVTFYIAWRMPDPLVTEDYYRQGAEINKTLDATSASNLVPAVQARNHAAAPVTPGGKSVSRP